VGGSLAAEARGRLLKRAFSFDGLRCPGSDGRRQFVAAIAQATVIRANLAPMGLPTD